MDNGHVRNSGIHIAGGRYKHSAPTELRTLAEARVSKGTPVRTACDGEADALVRSQNRLRERAVSSAERQK